MKLGKYLRRMRWCGQLVSLAPKSNVSIQISFSKDLLMMAWLALFTGFRMSSLKADASDQSLAMIQSALKTCW